jgi:hypothetical protein
MQDKLEALSLTSLYKRLVVCQRTERHKLPFVLRDSLENVETVPRTVMQGNQELDLASSDDNFLNDFHLNNVLADYLSDNKVSNLVSCTPDVHSVSKHVTSSQHVCLDPSIRFCIAAKFARKLELWSGKKTRVAPEIKEHFQNYEYVLLHNLCTVAKFKEFVLTKNL